MTTYSPKFPQTPQVNAIDFVNSDGAGAANSEELVQGGANGSKVFYISAVSDDPSVDTTISLYMVDASENKYPVGEVLIPDQSGFNSTTDPAKNVLDSDYLAWLPADNEIIVPSGWSLHAVPKAAVTSSYTVTLTAFFSDY